MSRVENIKKLSHLSFAVKKFLKYYPWNDCNPSQSKKLDKKISDCKVAIVSSAGLVVDDEHEPFDNNIKFGDWSYRVISKDVDSSKLKEYHTSNSFDHSGIKKNPFSALPITHLKELEKQGYIGSVSERHISLMGSNINKKKLLKHSVPKIIDIFKNDNVDIVIFVPV